jgi:hypothetical protein
LERITTLDNLPHWFLSTVPGLVNLFLRPSIGPQNYDKRKAAAIRLAPYKQLKRSRKARPYVVP